MGKIIKFPAHRSQQAQLVAMKLVADELDDIIIKGMTEEGLEAREIAGILAHRLGSLMRSMDGKSELWDVCQKVLKKQAVID